MGKKKKFVCCHKGRHERYIHVKTEEQHIMMYSLFVACIQVLLFGAFSTETTQL